MNSKQRALASVARSDDMLTTRSRTYSNLSFENGFH